MEFCFAKSTTDVIFKSLCHSKGSILVGTIGFFNVKIFFDRSYIDLDNSVIKENDKRLCPPLTWILREM